MTELEDDRRGDRTPGGLFRFGRDVGANLIANLVAAAIIYLLGVAWGLFPKNASAVSLAALWLICVVGFGLFTATIFHQHQPSEARWLTAAVCVFASVFYFLPFAGDNHPSRAEIIACATFATILITACIAGDIYFSRRKRPTRR